MNKRIPQPGDLVKRPKDDGLYYITYISDYTMSLMQIAPHRKWGRCLITTINDIEELYPPDHWNEK